MIPVLIALAVLGVLALVVYQVLAWRQLSAFHAALRETAGTRTRELENDHPSTHSGRLVLLLDYRAVLESANQYPRITEAQKARNSRTMAQIDRQVIRLKKATTRGIETRLAAEYANQAPAA
jgi:hypothetical protein